MQVLVYVTHPLPSQKYSCSTYTQVNVKKACLAADALSKLYEKKNIISLKFKVIIKLAKRFV